MPFWTAEAIAPELIAAQPRRAATAKEISFE
jgi:hypothetical protein